MDIEELHLEVTRNCTLECEHCLRGDRECLYMGLSVIDKVFENVKSVRNLLITGGEPLLAIKQLEEIAYIIENTDIKIDSILLITNGTVLSDRILNVLRTFQKHTRLSLRMSADIFHMMEIEKRGLTELREKNLRILKSQKFKDFSEYGENKESEFETLLDYKGRARGLTQERLDEINELSKRKYVIRPLFMEIAQAPSIVINKVFGYVTIDVYGNLVGYGNSYNDEDREAKAKGVNVLDMSLDDAIRAYSGEPKVQKKKHIFKSLAKR